MIQSESAKEAPLGRDRTRSRFEEVRGRTRRLCAPLAVEDHVPQSMEDASPTKWHLAHTTWFFERFVLRQYAKGYRVFDEGFEFLFNSYYDSIGERVPRGERGLMTRPTLDRVFEYREYVEQAVLRFLDSQSGEAGLRELELGLQHEMQHQELLVTDFKHLLGLHPNPAAYYGGGSYVPSDDPGPLHWLEGIDGLQTIGHSSEALVFAFDNESPHHKQFLAPYRIASRTVTNGEYLRFIQAGGYAEAQNWLSLGWQEVQANDWKHPLYWRLDENSGEWQEFTLWGVQPLDLNAPVCHLSYFEADAYARWSGFRLPTEAEWEVCAQRATERGHFGGLEHLHPKGQIAATAATMQNAFGDVWEWTSSSYAAYPGYQPVGGALGEYNGKFMCNQMVLRGGSCATPKDHLRVTYRNFFPAYARWQFSGIRLARD